MLCKIAVNSAQCKNWTAYKGHPVDINILYTGRVMITCTEKKRLDYY